MPLNPHAPWWVKVLAVVIGVAVWASLSAAIVALVMWWAVIVLRWLGAL